MKKILTGSKREQVLIRKAYMLENLKHLSNKNLCDTLLYMNTWNCQVGIYYQVTWFKYHELTYILSVWEDTINCHCLRTKTYWLWLFGQKWLSNCLESTTPRGGHREDIGYVSRGRGREFQKFGKKVLQFFGGNAKTLEKMP